MNREKLARMGINKDINDLYIKNGIYTPREQSLIVSALDHMGRTKDRSEYIKFAILTDTEDLAYYRFRQSQMYANYHSSVEPVDRFVTVAGDISTTLTRSGKIVFALPMDYLLWTNKIAAAVSVITQEISGMKALKGREILLAGQASQQARGNFERMGWTVHENTESRLLSSVQ